MHATLIWLGGIAGALFAIFRLLVFAKKNFMAPIVEYFKDNVADIQQLKDDCEEIWANCQRLTIMSNDMPIEERLNSGEKYVNRGYNGAVKAKYHQLKDDYENEQKNKEK